MPPQRELLENEKRENAYEERAEHVLRVERGERLRQELEQRDAEQRADGVADERRHEPRPCAGGDKQESRRDRQPAESAEQAEAESDAEQAHAARL